MEVKVGSIDDENGGTCGLREFVSNIIIKRTEVQKQQWKTYRPINWIVRFVIVANLEGNFALDKDMRWVCCLVACAFMKMKR